ncbi:MAG: hypothetical protein UX30_C0004G0013 [Candidatus Saccharibacteria bacterium GW2011_GWA2_46_10]|nr:MAG: hypothetical protein UX30_C0004G0013 [Candidatus Saccharibacteria bacterium GW2011_GWA2_46_10]
MDYCRSRKGYTFLLSTLFVGAVALAVTGTMLMLGWMALRNGVIIEDSGKAYELAMTCAERGLVELFNDENYYGDENISLGEDSCSILAIGGSGNENRTLCAEGKSGSSVRRMEIIIERILPAIKTSSWQEVDVFSSCPS